MQEEMLEQVGAYANKLADFLTIPYNLKNQVLAIGKDGSLGARELVRTTSIIENDTDLAIMQGDHEKFERIFDWWKRISRGGNLSDTASNSELNTWTYIPATDLVRNTTNSSTMIGLVSNERYDDYEFEVNLSSTSADDDWIGLIAAYAKDEATGLYHTLSVMRCGNQVAPATIEVNKNTTSAWIHTAIYNGLKWPNGVVATGPVGTSSRGNWSSVPAGANVKITRKGDILTIENSNFDGGAYVDSAKVVLDLKSDPRLAVFRKPQAFGYCAQSQPNSTWKVMQRPEVRLPIVDIRTWDKWVWENKEWVKYPSTKADLIADETLVVDWLMKNTTTGMTYILDSNTATETTPPRLFRL